MATRGTRKGEIKSAKARRPSSSSPPPNPPAPAPSSPPSRPARLFTSRPSGRGFLRDNPRSTKFSFNKSFQDRRGYYYKDATGRWRTPDGNVAPGQRRVQITTKTGERQTLSYRLRKAEVYNERRHARLFKIDAINNVRALGLDLTRKKFDRVAGKSRDPVKVRDRLKTFVRDQRSKAAAPAETRTFKEARREFARKSDRIDVLDSMIEDAGGPGRDPTLDEERLNLRRDVNELAEDLAEADELDVEELDFEAWGDTP